MKRTSLSLAVLLALLMGPLPLHAKPKIKPLPTPPPTWTRTATLTPTPALNADGTARWFGFDQAWGSAGIGPNQLTDPEGIWVSPSGQIAIADSGNNRVVIWDTDGKSIRSFGSWGSSAVWRNAPQFNRPGGAIILPSGQVLVADSQNHRIVVVDGRGLVVSTWGRRGIGDGEFDTPYAFALGKSGDIWVLDSGNSRLQLFSASGAFKGRWGTLGTSPGSLKYPLGLAMNTIEQIQVADTQNNRYQVFNSDGVPVTTQGWLGDGPNQFREPTGVVVMPMGLIALSDGPSGRVLIYNNRFEYVGEWRASTDPEWKGDAPDLRGISADNEGRLYLTDRVNQQVIRLKPLGKVSILAPKSPTPLPKQESLYGGAGFPVR